MIVTNEKRLANVKTRRETGFDYVVSCLNIQTPFGKREIREAKPFFPGEEEQLREELDKVERMMEFAKGHPNDTSKLSEIFMCAKDISGTIKRSASDVLSVVQIFEVKSAMLDMASIRRIVSQEGTEVPDEFIPAETEALLDILDPRGDRLNTFYIYDDFSEKLAGFRREKKDLDRKIRRAMKDQSERIRKEYGINLTPKFDIVIPKSSDALAVAKGIAELEQVGEDYMSVTFALVKNDEVYELTKRLEELNQAIDDEEAVVREKLSKDISRYADVLLENFRREGRLEFVLAKAQFAIEHRCVRPEIVDEHVIEFEDGRELQVEDILMSKGKEYCPVSISISEGVTCITGANMGGKTISLKLSGLVPILAQYGYFVPCTRARIGLSNFMQILIGDSQSVERGLSSFGSEMEELKEILDHATDRSLILIDEIASGTNPVEGLALTKSLVEYLMDKPYITLITTHFETVTEEEGVRNMQVRGLADAHFDKLDRELRHANRRERIDIISKYMDYRLELVGKDRQIPKDALNIARMLGINAEIIEGAKKYLK
jgi:DNA mismatch repair protein MutS2